MRHASLRRFLTFVSSVLIFPHLFCECLWGHPNSNEWINRETVCLNVEVSSEKQMNEPKEAFSVGLRGHPNSNEWINRELVCVNVEEDTLKANAWTKRTLVCECWRGHPRRKWMNLFMSSCSLFLLAMVLALNGAEGNWNLRCSGATRRENYFLSVCSGRPWVSRVEWFWKENKWDTNHVVPN